MTAAPPSQTAGAVAAAVDGRLHGDPERRLTAVRPLAAATAEHLSFLSNPKYRAQAAGSGAGVILCRPSDGLDGRDRIEVDDPYLALALVLTLFHPPRAARAGIHPRALVGEDCELGDGVEVGPMAVLGERCRVGAGTVLAPGVVLGDDVVVGEGCYLHPHVVVYPGCRIGSRVSVHAGAVIGSDGFGYAFHDGVHHKVPQVGSVVIEDDVEIGAGATIDRGALGDTRIGAGSKIDNLVMIAHNVEIGPASILVAQAGVAGSSRLGPGVILAGQAGVAGHLRVGAGARAAAKSAVLQDVPDGALVAGIPAIPMSTWRRAQAVFARLPEILRRLRALERRVPETRDREEDPRR